MTQCPRRSLRPPRQSRHCGVPASRLPRESPSRHTLSISAWKRRSGSSLAFACNTVWSLRTFSDPARFSPVVTPFPLSALLSNQGSFPPPALPGFRGNTSPSATLPARPAPHGVPVVCAHHRQGFPCCSHPPLPCVRRHYPGGTGRCSRRSLPGQWQPSPAYGRVGSRIPSFEACSAFHSRCSPHGRWVAQGDPFARSASGHVVTSITRSDYYRLERQLPGGIRTR